MICTDGAILDTRVVARVKISATHNTTATASYPQGYNFYNTAIVGINVENATDFEYINLPYASDTIYNVGLHQEGIFFWNITGQDQTIIVIIAKTSDLRSIR